MNGSIFDKITAEKSLFYILIAAIVIVIIVVVYLFVVFGTAKIKLTSPVGGDEWEIGQKYEITWKAKKIGKVGIVLFHESEAEWIAEGVSASSGKYEWEVYQGHKYGNGFWIAIFEYPWKKNGRVDYSNGALTITYPTSTNCDILSIDNEWPYMASDYPGVRKVFVTQEEYKGNLDGLAGANQKCQEEAGKAGFEGNWIAFLGGDADEETAIERLRKSRRGMDGIFIQAKPSGELIHGATCHRLLGKELGKFLEKFSIPDVWLGRIDKTSSKNCIVSTATQVNLSEKYSYTVTCQNWTNSKQFADKYREDPISNFPICYTPSGSSVRSTALGGLGSSKSDLKTGGYCHRGRNLLCIED